MIKQQWIFSQSQSLNITNPNTLWSALQDLATIENPAPVTYISKQLSILEVSQNISIADKRLLMADVGYQSLLVNLNKGDMQSAALDIQLLATTPNLSQATIDILNRVLTAPPQTIPDPNWQSTIKVKGHIAAGFDSLTLQEIVEALSN